MIDFIAIVFDVVVFIIAAAAADVVVVVVVIIAAIVEISRTHLQSNKSTSGTILNLGWNIQKINYIEVSFLANSTACLLGSSIGGQIGMTAMTKFALGQPPPKKENSKELASFLG